MLSDLTALVIADSKLVVSYFSRIVSLTLNFGLAGVLLLIIIQWAAVMTNLEATKVPPQNGSFVVDVAEMRLTIQGYLFF